jgi:hypothetical protein
MKIGPTGPPPDRIGDPGRVQESQQQPGVQKSDSASAAQAPPTMDRFVAGRRSNVSPSHHVPPPATLTPPKLQAARGLADKLQSSRPGGSLTSEDLLASFMKLQVEDPGNNPASMDDLSGAAAKLRDGQKAEREEKLSEMQQEMQKAQEYAEAGKVFSNVFQAVQDLLGGGGRGGGGESGGKPLGDAVDSAAKSIRSVVDLMGDITRDRRREIRG